jgi:hypothetical protein
MVERSLSMREVTGSTPVSSIAFFQHPPNLANNWMLTRRVERSKRLSSLVVERLPSKQKIEGSIPP